MERTKIQLMKDIQFCKNVLGLSPEDTDQMISVCDKMQIGAEYFSEEFVFEADCIETVLRVHDPEYLQIKWRLA